MVTALFTADGDTYVPSEITRGPWSDDAQHAGPVAALVAGLVEEVDRDRDMAVARITFELLRPLPLRPLRVSARAVTGGRSTDRVTAEVSDASSGELLATALALRIRRKHVPVPPHGDPADRLPAPSASEPVDVSPWAGRVSFVGHAIEMRLAAGTPFMQPGPASVWFRLRVSVVEGRPVSPLQRVCAAADSGNGISNVADFATFLYINPDLTVALHRAPQGEWIGVDAVTLLSDSGIGGTQTGLYDEEGRCGLAYQSLLVSTR